MKTMNVNHQSTIGQLEDLTQCENHLQFVSEVLQRSQVSDAIQSELKQQIELIRQRYSDPNLYLAVVGEFSSGKSTFINALLRDELLEAAVIPTTATATKIQHGSELSVEVQIKGDRPGKIKTRPQSQKITIPWLGIQGMDNRQFIRTVTTQENMANQVSAVTIFHPATFLSNGIVIIDTPGVNANCTHAQHGTVTQQVVDAEVDAAVIVIPATTPLPQSLANFLLHSLHHCLHRCVFVVTKMDVIRSREQSNLLDNIKARLTTMLELEYPTIFAASPQIVIDQLNGDPVSSSLQHWQGEFEDLEASLWKRLRHERVLSIAEKLLRLLTQLFDQIDASMQAEWLSYQTKQAAIEGEVIQDLRSFASDQYQICNRSFENQAVLIQTKIEQLITKSRHEAIQSIEEKISAATTTTLDDILKNQVKTILEENQKLLQAKLEKVFKILSQVAIENGQAFDHQFSQVYQRLQALSGNIKADLVPIADQNQFNALDITNSVQSLQQQFEQKDNELVGSGAISGAVIGTLFMPGFGTAIGAVVGGILPLFFTSLEQRKAQILDTLRSNLYQQYDISEKQIQKAFQAATKTLAFALHQRIETYIETYQAIVDQMLSEQQTELQRLNHCQKMLQLDLADIQQRRELLAVQQKHVAKMSTHL
jgi:GTPase Era involved in 16S rRNA processing/gas vesicle protein